MFKSSTRLLLWAFGIVLLGVIAFLAVDVGLVDAGVAIPAQAWLREWVKFLSFQYGINRPNVDLALKVVGLAISTVLGMLGFLRLLHYAQGALPQRIQDYIDSVDEEHLRTRAALIAPYLTTYLKDRIVPQPVGFWRGVLDRIGLDASGKEIRRLKNGLNTLDEQIAVLSRKKQSCELEKATAHLVRGLEQAAEASTSNADQDTQRKGQLAALKEFEIVVKLNGADLDGLEQAARYCFLLSSQSPAIDHLKKMARAAATVGKPVLQARALRFHAEILDDQGTSVSLNGARALLESAIRVLDRAIDASPERSTELALLFEHLGSVQTRREKYGKAERALAEAERRFKALPLPVGPAGIRRVSDLQNQLANDRQGEPPEALG